MGAGPMRIPVLLFALASGLPAAAQDRPAYPGLDPAPQSVDTQPGEPGEPGEPVDAGQQQRSKQVVGQGGVTPIGRVGGRIENRVQSRISNRLDRNYRPAAPPAPGEAVRRARDSARR